LVFASTDAVCGEDGFARREDAPMGQEMSVYACSKLLGERLGVMYSAQRGIGFIALRYSLTFGPNPVRGAGVAQAFAKMLSALEGKSLTISDFSGEWRQQVTYVRDVASATSLALMHESPSHNTYNVAGPYENYMSMKEIHAVLRSIAPTTGEVTFTGPKRLGGPCDISRIQDDLGYRPHYSLALAVRDRVEEMKRWA
jgi:nucleoside-diphosphate-sugar epimerase